MNHIAPHSDLVPIRASSLSDLLDCPARWEAKHINGLRLPRSAAAQLGTAIHASTGVFDASRLPGVIGGEVSADDAAGALVDTIHHPEEDVDWEDTKPSDVEKIGLALHAKYCAEVAPTQSYRGVEVMCERLDIPDLGISLTGTTDRVREVSGGSGIADLKTGGRAVSADGKANTAGHALQLGVYELLAEHSMGIPITAPALVIGMNTGKTTAAQRVAASEVHDARSMLIGSEDQAGALEYVSKIVKTGLFFGNPRSVLCSQKYCPAHPTCPFRA